MESEKKPTTNDRASTSNEKKVEASSKMAKTEKQKTEQTTSGEKVNKSAAQNNTVVQKKSGAGLAILAILIALGVGGAGYYFGQQQLTSIQQKLTALESKPASTDKGETVEIPSFEKERAELGKLTTDYQGLEDKLAKLESAFEAKQTEVKTLQDKVTTLSNNLKTEPNDWILSEADFLLSNALRKLVLDNDVDTSIELLKVVAESLEQVSDPRVFEVRAALNNDLKQLLSVNNVDQNAIMQRLSQLANTIDELNVLNVNFGESAQANDQLSDSVADWENNLKKSASSFLNHFIRVTPKGSQEKVLLAPNQDVYLRENIRLRLQIAILAVPRQQNELYKQSLEAVSSWVRSYFDTSTPVAENFLKEIDELSDVSIYVDVPHKLSSLTLLDELLNRQGHEVKPISIEADKALKEDSAEATPKSSAEPEKNAPQDGNVSQDTQPVEQKPAETTTASDETQASDSKEASPEVEPMNQPNEQLSIESEPEPDTSSDTVETESTEQQ
ncbi:uroporphyrinogen-III C-methyltransferase [Conservatibacter flavescens]